MRGFTKNQYIKWNCLKMWTWTVLRGGVGGLGEEDGGGAFRGVKTPMHTISS